MGLITQMTFTEDVPHEPGHTITFRMLSLPALQEAQRAKLRQTLADFPIERMAALQQSQAAEKPVNPADSYDGETLLRASVVDWSYDAPVDVAQLDARTAAWAVGVIIDRNGLGETEGERGEGSGASTVPSTV